MKEINHLIEAAEAMTRAVAPLNIDASQEDSTAFCSAMAELENATTRARFARREPDVMPFWERRITIEEIYWPAVYFDAQYNGEALTELVEELWDMGTAGKPKPITDAVADAIENGSYDGVIARVSIQATDRPNTRYSGVVSAKDFYAIPEAVLAWAEAICAKQFKEAA